VGRDTAFRFQIERAFIDANVNRRMVFHTNHFATACALVAQGAGVTIVDPFSALAHSGKGIRLRPFAPEIPFRVNLIRPANQPAPVIVEDFLTQLAEDQLTLNSLLKDLITRD
jgi:DNA-binding transcriptional LysR family regulator